MIPKQQPQPTGSKPTQTASTPAQASKPTPAQSPLVGIGVQFSAEAEAMSIKAVVAGGGAEAAGIVVGDRVIAVDGVAVAKLGANGTITKIHGAAGTRVSLTLQRNATP